MLQLATVAPPNRLISAHLHRRRQRAAYLLAAVPASLEAEGSGRAGLSFAEIAEEFRSHGLAAAYGPGHAEWEYWLASRIEAADLYTRPQTWSWPTCESPQPTDHPGPALCIAANRGQGIKDLQRAMPCTLGLYHHHLLWPRCSDHHCRPTLHACAPGALAALLSPRAAYLGTLIGLDPGYLRARVHQVEETTRAAYPWLTHKLPPEGYRD